MKLFDDTVEKLIDFIKKNQELGRSIEHYAQYPVAWSKASTKDIVLGSDVGVELGHPKEESVSFLIWTDKKDLIKDDRITIIGPDVFESKGKSLSFGKVTMVCVKGFNEENAYERHQEMDLIRHKLSLKGYMTRAISQYMREWSRISKEAVDNGFSFTILGSSLMEQLKQMEFVTSTETLFVTAAKADVTYLKTIGDRVERSIKAITKMSEEIDFD